MVSSWSCPPAFLQPAAIIPELASLGVPLFVIAEQDLYPCPPSVPFPIAVRTREFLNRYGLGSWPPKEAPA